MIFGNSAAGGASGSGQTPRGTGLNRMAGGLGSGRQRSELGGGTGLLREMLIMNGSDGLNGTGPARMIGHTPGPARMMGQTSPLMRRASRGPISSVSNRPAQVPSMTVGVQVRRRRVLRQLWSRGRTLLCHSSLRGWTPPAPVISQRAALPHQQLIAAGAIIDLEPLCVMGSLRVLATRLMMDPGTPKPQNPGKKNSPPNPMRTIQVTPSTKRNCASSCIAPKGVAMVTNATMLTPSTSFGGALMTPTRNASCGAFLTTKRNASSRRDVRK